MRSCEGFKEQPERHLGTAQQIFDWHRGTVDMLHARRWSGTIVNIVERLVEWPVITNRFVQDEYGVSPSTAKNAVDRLVETGVLEERTGRAEGRIFGATEVMQQQRFGLGRGRGRR